MKTLFTVLYLAAVLAAVNVIAADQAQCTTDSECAALCTTADCDGGPESK